MKEGILRELAEIQMLKQTIEKRIIAGFTPVYELSDTEQAKPLNKEHVQQRIHSLAEELIRDEAIHYPVLLSVMHGALPFTSSLQKVLTEQAFPFQFETIQVCSYSGTQSTGSVEINSHSKILLGGRDVIVVDDICDTGKTYNELKKLLLANGARSVELMALVDKIQPRESAGNVSPKYAGFTISPKAFIAGFGMDFDELLRNSEGINIVDLSTLPTDEEQVLLDKEAQLNEDLIKRVRVESNPVIDDRNRLFSQVAVHVGENIHNEVPASINLGIK